MNGFFECTAVKLAITPVNLNTAANPGGWIDVSNYHRVGALLLKGADTAAGAVPTLHFEQALAVTGTTGAKGVNVDYVWEKSGTATVYTRHDVNGDEFELTGKATTTGIWGVELQTTWMDLNGGFRYFRLRIPDSSTGNTTQLAGACYFGLQPRYGGGTAALSL